MFSAFLLAASMLMISDRDNFWDNEKASEATHIANVDEQGITEILTTEEETSAWDEIRGKKILLLIHGFENPIPYGFYHNVRVNVQHLDSACDYDMVIGYLWPSFDSSYQYYSAENIIREGIAARFQNHLEKLNGLASRIDIIAHSMGNRVVLEALKSKTPLPYIRNFFLFAPAVNDDSIYPSKEYYSSTQGCENLYVFHSERDSVLKWYYPLPEWEEALGYEGDIDPSHLPQQVQMVDCTSVIDQHSAYLFCLPIYNYIQEIAKNQYLKPYYAQDVTILEDGSYTILRWRHPKNQFKD